MFKSLSNLTKNISDTPDFVNVFEPKVMEVDEYAPVAIISLLFVIVNPYGISAKLPPYELIFIRLPVLSYFAKNISIPPFDVRIVLSNVAVVLN